MHTTIMLMLRAKYRNYAPNHKIFLPTGGRTYHNVIYK